MGTLRAASPDPTGQTYNGVLLGEPVDIDGDPETWEWDDSAFPNGECAVVDGALVVTVDEVDAA
jgi:hypothetical protein